MSSWRKVPVSRNCSMPRRTSSTFASDIRASLDAQLARDHHLLHLVGALADGEDLGVAVEAADRVLLDVAVAAVDLDGLLGRADGESACDQLGLSRGQGE